jgi:acyl-homoserine lactone acylase PvdQ
MPAKTTTPRSRKRAEAEMDTETAPPETLAHTVPGLEAPAEIVVDQWGIPHIRATTRRDIFFVQGFNAARDRLWQLDIWRKRGLGRLGDGGVPLGIGRKEDMRRQRRLDPGGSAPAAGEVVDDEAGHARAFPRLSSMMGPSHSMAIERPA